MKTNETTNSMMNEYRNFVVDNCTVEESKGSYSVQQGQQTTEPSTSREPSTTAAKPTHKKRTCLTGTNTTRRRVF